MKGIYEFDIYHLLLTILIGLTFLYCVHLENQLKKLFQKEKVRK